MSNNAAEQKPKPWNVYLRQETGDCVLLTDGAWTRPANANVPHSDEVPVVLLRSRDFPTFTAAEIYRLKKHRGERTYAAREPRA